MTFRFANGEGRGALVDADGCWFDASRPSDGVISADPMGAWRQLDERHRAMTDRCQAPKRFMMTLDHPAGRPSN